MFRVWYKNIPLEGKSDTGIEFLDFASHEEAFDFTNHDDFKTGMSKVVQITKDEVKLTRTVEWEILDRRDDEKSKN